MPNGGLPSSHLECKQYLLCIVLYWRGEGLLEGSFARPILWFFTSALGLKLPPILCHRQPFYAWWWSTAPSSNVAFQSCLFWRRVMQFIIRFFQIAITPFIHQHHGNGRYWLWMDLERVHYANDTLIFLWQQGTCFILKDAHSRCITLLWPVEDFWSVFKKTVYDEGWEATSIPALKQRIKEEARQIPFSMILCVFNMVNEQLTVCAQIGHWAVYC